MPAAATAIAHALRTFETIVDLIGHTSTETTQF